MTHKLLLISTDWTEVFGLDLDSVTPQFLGSLTSGSKKESKFQKSDFTEAFIDFIAENDLKEKLSAPFYTQTQIQTPKTEKQIKPVQRTLSIDDEKPQMPIELNLSSNKIEKLDTNDSDRQSWPNC